MPETMYKAIRPDGTDFRTGTVQWAPKDRKARKGRVVKHPTATEVGATAAEYLSVSVDPTDLPGASWPMRMLVVEPVGGAATAPNDGYRNKRACVAFRVVEELDPSVRFGPQGPEIAALIDRARKLTGAELIKLGAARDVAWDAARGVAWDVAWDAARGAARDAARGAAWGAARDVAWGAPRGVAWDAVLGLLVRDLIPVDYYNTLTGPWRKTVGPIHAEDAPL